MLIRCLLQLENWFSIIWPLAFTTRTWPHCTIQFLHQVNIPQRLKERNHVILKSNPQRKMDALTQTHTATHIHGHPLTVYVSRSLCLRYPLWCCNVTPLNFNICYSCCSCMQQCNHKSDYIGPKILNRCYFINPGEYVLVTVVTFAIYHW